MRHPTLKLKKIGQIQDANIEFGDLTVLVGPQASGKSIFLQMLKLIKDDGYIIDKMKKHGLIWDKRVATFFERYFGEGMGDIWKDGEQGSSILYDEESFKISDVIQAKRKSKEESLFLIPAQRVLTLARGWPRPFSDFPVEDPFCVKDFSEKLQGLMRSGLGASESGNIFPQNRRFKTEIRTQVADAIFHGFNLQWDQAKTKRLVLKGKGSSGSLPFMVWSAGQREFVPLLMGFYWLLPLGNLVTREKIKWVIIEEPETGLHPQAISVVLLIILELLSRGYHVCISTHSPHVLDVVWALQIIKKHNAKSDFVLELFNVNKSLQMMNLANEVMKKKIKVYYFNREKGNTQDISNLDPGSEDSTESGWGGLSGFSGHVADVVAKVVNS